MKTGYELGREIVAKHKVDRFPDVPSNYRHLGDEVAELGEALMRRFAAHCVPHDGGTAEGCPGCFADAEEQNVRKELGDVGLTLYTLADKLGLDLDQCMAEVVAGETR